MDLFPQQYRECVPPIGVQRDDPEPTVYVHFFVPDAPWSYFVTEGEARAKDYVLFGFLLGSEEDHDWSWRELRLSELEQLVLRGCAVQRDERFVPGRLTDVVVLPDY